MMKGALILYFVDNQTVPQIDKAAKVFGGTDILLQFISEIKFKSGQNSSYNCAFHAWKPRPAMMVGCNEFSVFTLL